MTTPGWQRWAARIVLVTFSTCFVACGGSGAPPPTTTTLPVATTTVSLPPPTMPPTLPPTMPPPPPPPSPTLPAQPPDQLGKQELRQLVAPVALYPDVVLGSLLPATTFPEQIHDAAGYIGTAERVDRVPDDRGWDGSIVGLLQFPDVVRWLDENPAWTDEMGQAVTYQQADVLQAIQDYRKSTMDVGNLKSNQYQKVSVVSEDIRIEPARPDIVYVPSYDPELALQPQPVATAPGINPWIAFGGGAVVGALGAWALYSIFDDDDHDHGHGYGRHIRHYDNYYYSRGRRPREVEWTPRTRPMRQRTSAIERPRRLEHRAASRPSRAAAPLRPPTAKPGETRREMRQENRQERRDTKQERREQKQENKQERRDTRQERQMQQQQQRQDQRGQREQRQQQQREQRQQQQMHRQESRQQQQMERQQRQQQQREQRQQQQMHRQEGRQQQQMQRQENRQQRREGGGQGQGGNNKKKKQQQQQ